MLKRITEINKKDWLVQINLISGKNIETELDGYATEQLFNVFSNGLDIFLNNAGFNYRNIESLIILNNEYKFRIEIDNNKELKIYVFD